MDFSNIGEIGDFKTSVAGGPGRVRWYLKFQSYDPRKIAVY